MQNACISALWTLASYDAAYQAVLVRGSALGYALPDAVQRKRQNQLILDLKAAGIWAKLDAWYIFDRGSAGFATLNWKNPVANQCTLVNSPTWTEGEGFAGDTTAYIDTNFNCAVHGVNYTLNNASRGVWIYLASEGTTGPEGISGQTLNCLLNGNSGAQRINQGTTNLSISVDLRGTGLKAINRTSSSNVVCFSETTRSDATAASDSVSSANQVLLHRAMSWWLGGLSAYWIGAALVDEHTALHNALSTYFGTP